MKKVWSLIVMSSAIILMFTGVVHAITVYDDKRTGQGYGLGMNDWAAALSTAQLSAVNAVDFSQTPAVVHSGSFVPYYSGGPQPVNVDVYSTQSSSLYGISVPADNANLWYDRVGDANPTSGGPGAVTTTTFRFKGATSAFGGMWDLTDGGTSSSTGLILTLIYGDGSRLKLGHIAGDAFLTPAAGSTILSDLGKTSWGIILDPGETPFFALEVTDFGGPKTFTLQDFAYSTVPEPSTVLLIGAGFGGLLVLRRRKAVK